MKPNESRENYLEAVLILGERQGSVRGVDVANFLGFSKPSVSIAMSNLRTAGLVQVDGDGFLRLTGEGLELAEHVYERHKLLTRALVRLGVSEQTAADDACRIEHVISQESFDRIRDRIASCPD